MEKSINDINDINNKFIKCLSNILAAYSSNVNYSDSKGDEKFDELIKSIRPLEIKYLPYTEISSLVYSYDEYLVDDFIAFCNEKLQKQNQIPAEKTDVFYKLITHINLANLQKRSLFREQQNVLNLLVSKTESMSNKYQDLKKDYDEIAAKSEKVMIDFVAILGVFASIIFAVFGGFKQLEALGNNLQHISIYKMFLYIGSTGIVITSIIFISFYAVSKLTRLKLSDCNCRGCCNCPMHKKYSVLMITYYLLTSMICLGFIILLLGHYYDFGLTYNTSVGLIIIALFSILPISPAIIFIWKKYSQKRTNKK